MILQNIIKAHKEKEMDFLYWRATTTKDRNRDYTWKDLAWERL
jgi:hypothetical protein